MPAETLQKHVSQGTGNLLPRCQSSGLQRALRGAAGAPAHAGERARAPSSPGDNGHEAWQAGAGLRVRLEGPPPLHPQPTLEGGPGGAGPRRPAGNPAAVGGERCPRERARHSLLHNLAPRSPAHCCCSQAAPRRPPTRNFSVITGVQGSEGVSELA